MLLGIISLAISGLLTYLIQKDLLSIKYTCISLPLQLIYIGSTGIIVDMENPSSIEYILWVILTVLMLYVIYTSQRDMKLKNSANYIAVSSLVSDLTVINDNISEKPNNETGKDSSAPHTGYAQTDKAFISDKKLPHLIQLNCEKSPSPKFNRTLQEEELSFNFIEKYGSKVSSMENNFESLNEQAHNTENLNKRIKILIKVALAFEKAKEFCYSKGAGGKIYFQDMWEYQHNSQNPCFSYLDPVLYELNTLSDLNEDTEQNTINARWRIPYLEQQILESYELMKNTNNPETLCSRYKYMTEKIDELTIYKEQNLFDNNVIEHYKTATTDDNYYNLILSCYQKYVDKANTELKTQKGVNNRIKKFWQIIHDNVTPEFFNERFSDKLLDS